MIYIYIQYIYIYVYIHIPSYSRSHWLMGPSQALPLQLFTESLANVASLSPGVRMPQSWLGGWLRRKIEPLHRTSVVTEGKGHGSSAMAWT